jgi:hypothetical protein
MKLNRDVSFAKILEEQKNSSLQEESRERHVCRSEHLSTHGGRLVEVLCRTRPLRKSEGRDIMPSQDRLARS